MSRKRINYYANVHELTSLIGVSVWVVEYGFFFFLLWQTESASVYHGSPESVLQNF